MLKAIHHLLFWMLALASAASAQEAYILGIGGGFNSVDLKTGVATFIGFDPAPNLWSGMAVDSQGRIIAANGAYDSAYEIYEINPSNGQITLISQTNLFGLAAIAFDDQDVLYALNDRTAPSGVRPMDLYTVDINTGSTSLVGDTGIHNALALDFHDGLLWTHNPYNGIHTIDPVTGIAVDVNNQFTGPNPSTISLCFSDSGVLYFFDEGLWAVDKETGTFSLIDVLTPFAWWAEAVFVEGPQDPFALWLSGRTEDFITVKVSGATPGGQIAFGWSSRFGGPTTIPAGYLCAGVEMDLAANMQIAGIVTADSNGHASLGPEWIPAIAVENYRIQAIDLTTCETSNKVVVWF